MTKFQRVSDPIHSRYISWKSQTTLGRKGWLDRAQNSEEYYYGDVEQTETLFTAAQKSNVEGTTNIPVSMNWLHPVCNQKLALLTQTKPSVKTLSLDGRAKAHAQVLDKMKHGVFYNSNAQVEVENMIKDMLITGMGHIMVVPTDFYAEGFFNVRIRHVPFDEVILDINAKSRTLDDMEGMFVERAFTIPKALQLYGTIIDGLPELDGKPVDIRTFTGKVWTESELTDKQDVTTTDWNTQDRVIVREYYEKVFTTMYGVRNDDGLLQYIFKENLEDEQSAATINAELELPDIYIKKIVILGDFEVWEEILPITEYPLKTSFFEWGGRPYRSYGMIHFTRGMQEAFDKILQIMILNGILSNNSGWIAPKGSIPEEDRKKWEEFGNNPQVIKEYVPKMIDNKIIVPQRDEVQQLSNFYPLVLDMLKGGIEYSTGVTAVLQGNAKEANVEVFSSLQQYQNAAMQRVMLATSHINQTMKDLGQTLQEWLIATLTPDKFHFFDEKGNLTEVTLVRDIVNDLKTFKFLTVTVPSTAMPTQRLAVATELAKIAQSSPDPAERQLLTQKAMELSDIQEFDDITAKLDSVKKAQAEVEQMKEAYDRLLETSKQMENKFINISLENRILKQLTQSEKQVAEKFAELETKLRLADKIAEDQIKGDPQPKSKGK